MQMFGVMDYGIWGARDCVGGREIASGDEKLRQGQGIASGDEKLCQGQGIMSGGRMLAALCVGSRIFRRGTVRRKTKKNLN